MPDHTHAHQFPNTRWTMIARSGEADGTTRQRALSDLCERYWPPVYAFVRSKGNSPHDAEDITQGFFAQLLERRDIAQADASKGKFRTFLLASAKNYMANEWRRANRQKRGGGKVIVSLSQDEGEERFHLPEPGHSLTPEKIYERQWVLTLLENVLEELGERYATDGKGELFDALRPSLTSGGDLPPYAEIASRLQMSEASLRVAVHRLRQRYRALLNEHVADTIGPEEDTENELAQLMGAFS